MSLSLLIKSIIKTYYISCSGVHIPPNIDFKYLIKDAIIDNMRDGDTTSELEYLQDWPDLQFKQFYLPQSFITTVNKPRNRLEKPFLLIPLFKITDIGGEEVNYKFFQGEKNNTIEVDDNKWDCYLSKQRTPRAGEASISIKVGEGVIINKYDLNSAGKNSFFIFKDHNSDCAMVYVGLFLKNFYQNIVNGELREIYEYFINRNDNVSAKIKEQDIQLEIRLDMSEFQSTNKFLSVSKNKHTGLGIFIDFPKKTEGPSSSDLIIKLRGTNVGHYSLLLEITKTVENESVDDLASKLIFLDQKSLESYKLFKMRSEGGNSKKIKGEEMQQKRQGRYIG